MGDHHLLATSVAPTVDYLVGTMVLHPPPLGDHRASPWQHVAAMWVESPSLWQVRLLAEPGAQTGTNSCDWFDWCALVGGGPCSEEG